VLIESFDTKSNEKHLSLHHLATCCMNPTNKSLNWIKFIKAHPNRKSFHT